MLASAAPFTSPRPSISVPDIGAATEDERNPRAGLSKDKGALRTSLASRENVMAVQELLLQSSLPSFATGVAITDPSDRSPDAEHTGDHPLKPLHGPDDIA